VIKLDVDILCLMGYNRYLINIVPLDTFMLTSNNGYTQAYSL